MGIVSRDGKILRRHNWIYDTNKHILTHWMRQHLNRPRSNARRMKQFVHKRIIQSVQYLWGCSTYSVSQNAVGVLSNELSQTTRTIKKWMWAGFDTKWMKCIVSIWKVGGFDHIHQKSDSILQLCVVIPRYYLINTILLCTWPHENRINPQLRMNRILRLVDMTAFQCSADASLSDAALNTFESIAPSRPGDDDR